MAPVIPKLAAVIAPVVVLVEAVALVETKSPVTVPPIIPKPSKVVGFPVIALQGGVISTAAPVPVINPLALTVKGLT